MDFDRNTGAVIDNYASAVQGVGVILSTRLGSLVMLREFGGGVVELLGRAMTPSLFGLFRVVLVAAIDTWEPRFRVRQIDFSGSVDELRAGNATFQVEVDWRPGGHLSPPDETVESVRRFLIRPNGSGVLTEPVVQ